MVRHQRGTVSFALFIVASVVVIYNLLCGQPLLYKSTLGDAALFDERNLLSVNPYFYVSSDPSLYRNLVSATAGDAADDHGGHIPLFGAMTQIDSKILTYSLLIVVVAVICVEYLFHLLHVFTNETPFIKLIVAIEKELMVVGSTAFIIKIVINTTDFLDDDWFFALEFADLLVPMFSFSSSILGIVLIFMSLKQCDVWCRAYHLKVEEILDDYYDYTHGYHRFLWAPLNKGISQMEFRIFHDIFCDLYRIQRKAFAFDEYAQRVFHEFVLDIIEIRLINWALFICFLLVNMIKNSGGQTIYDCHDDDIECIDQNSAQVFTYAGFALFVMTCVFVGISRRYEILIIRKRGIKCIEEYPDFLHWVENTPDVASGGTRMGTEDLKRVMQEMKHGHFESGEKGVTEVLSNLTEISSTLASSSGKLSGNLKKSFSGKEYEPNAQFEKALQEIDGEKEREQLELAEQRKSSQADAQEVARIAAVEAAIDLHSIERCEDDTKDNDGDDGDNSPRNLAAIAPIGNNEFTDVGEVGGFQSDANPSGDTEYNPAPKRLPPISNKDKPSRATSEEPIVERKKVINRYMRMTEIQIGKGATSPDSKKSHYIHQKPAYVKEVFLFGRPEIYFESVQLLIMLVALYLALWLVNYSSTHISGLWKFLSFLPALLSAVNYMFIVKSAALLKAVYDVDKEAILEVLEQTEGSQVLGETIRLKLLSKLNLEDPYEQLKVLFMEIDNNRSSTLSRTEFEVLMSKLHISFSRKKWNQIYHEIDRNYDDMISFEEFFLFLFPNHTDALSLEKRRLKIVKNRVAMKSMRAALRKSRRMGRLNCFRRAPQVANEQVEAASTVVADAPK